MRVTERNNHAPSGLTRFLRMHEECQRGLEILRDEGLVTIVCHGCESSFSYLTNVPPGNPTEVEQALEALASNRSRPAVNVDGAGGSKRPEADAESFWSPPQRLPRPARAPSPPPTTPASRRPSMLSAARRVAGLTGESTTADPSPGPPPAGPAGHAGKPKRLPPPGPLAPRQRPARPRLHQLTALAGRSKGLAIALKRRRQPVAMAVLSLAGAYVLIALSAGGEPSSSETVSAPGGTEVPLQAPPPEDVASGAVADGERTLESFDAGGPDATPVSGAGHTYELTMPPGWEQGSTDTDSALFQASSGNAHVLVRTEKPEEGRNVSELADRGAVFLALRLPAGARVERIPSRPEGELLAVARTSGGDEVMTAYVAQSDGIQYLVISSYEEDASSMERLQAEGAVRSFDPRPSSK